MYIKDQLEYQRIIERINIENAKLEYLENVFDITVDVTCFAETNSLGSKEANRFVDWISSSIANVQNKINELEDNKKTLLLKTRLGRLEFGDCYE